MNNSMDKKEGNIANIIAAALILIAGIILLLNSSSFTGMASFNLNDVSKESINNEIIIELDSAGSKTVYIELNQRSFSKAEMEVSGEELNGIFPLKPTIDILADGEPEWSYGDEFDSTAAIPDFSKQLNKYLENCGNLLCNVPIKIFSESAGRIVLKGLSLEYAEKNTGEENIQGGSIGEIPPDFQQQAIGKGKTGGTLTIAENSESSTSSEWRMFGRFLNHTRYNPINAPANLSLNVNFFTTGDDVASSPAVADGIAYVGSYDKRLYALNASNISRQIANFTTGGAIYSSPAIANGIVYVGSQDDSLYALNASNISQMLGNFSTGDDVDSSPAIANGTVYVGSDDNFLYALNASNISRQIANFTAGGDIRSSPAVANGVVYVGSADNRTYALNASNISKQIGNFSTGQDVDSSPAVADGIVYIGSYDNNLYALNASNISKQIGNFTAGDWILSSPAVANGIVYVGSRDDKLYALNASNISRQIANYTTGGDVDSSPAVANGIVYVGSFDNSLYALNASNISKMLDNFSTGGMIYSFPAVANGTVYVGSNDNRLYSFDFLETIAPTVYLTSPANGTIYISTNNVTLNVTATDNIELDNCTLWSNISGAWQVNETRVLNRTTANATWNFTDMTDSSYIWNAYCCDNLSNCAFNLTNYTFTVLYDAIAPRVYFTLPTETSGIIAGRNYIAVNITSNDTNIRNLTVKFYNSTGLIYSNLTDKLCYQETATNSTSCGGINAGSYDFSNDLNDNEWNSTYNTNGLYYINYSKPSFATNYSEWKIGRASQTVLPEPLPVEYTNETVYLSSSCWNNSSTKITLMLNISIPGALSAACYNGSNWIVLSTVAVGAGVDYFFTEEGMRWNTSVLQYYSNYSNLIDGIYYFNATAYDLAGNTNSTETRNFTVDTTLPNITFASPTETSGITIGRNFILVNTTVNDTNFKNLTVFLYNSSYGLVNETSSTSSSSLFLNFTNLTGQRYYFNATAYDLANNSNSTATRTVIVDLTSPKIDYTAPTLIDNSKATGAEINITITNASDLNTFKFEFNGTNYTFYNDSLLLMFNFDNITLIGDNYTQRGNLTVDVSKYGNNGTIYGATYNVTGKYGGAWEFDGVNDYISVPNFNVNATQLSVAFWFNTRDSATTKRIIEHDWATGAFTNHISSGNINIAFKFTDESSSQISASINANTWYYLVQIYNGTSSLLYLNGAQKTSSSDNKALKNVSAELQIGSVGYPFNGTIDEVRIWNRSLSSAEITQLYKSNFNKYDTDKWSFYSNQSNLTEGNYTYAAYAIDDVGNSNATDQRDVEIDITKPNITFVSQTESSGVYLNRNYSIINISFYDLNLKNATLYLYNSTYDLINTTNSSVSPFLTNFTNMAEGLYYFNATAFDLAGNSNSTETRNFTVDTTLPNLTFVSPTETSGITIGRNFILVNATVNDTNFRNLTIFLYNSSYGIVNSTSTTSASYFLNFTNLTDQRYYFNATAYDLANNSNSTNTRNVLVDLTAPTLLITKNATQLEYGSQSININWSVSDSYSVNFTKFNVTYPNSTLIYSSNSDSGAINLSSVANLSALGNYTINLWANDSVGNSNFTNDTFSVIDTIKPNITLVSQTESSGVYLNRNYSIINISFYDLNLKNATVYLYNSAYTLINATNSSVSPFLTNFSNLADGLYYFNATAFDLAGNSNSTETRNFTVDTTLPNITFISPTDNSGSYVNRNFILVNITVNDTNFKNLTIFLYNSTYALINITNTSSTTYFLNYTNLTEQRYYFNATAYDLANNSNSTATRNVTIDMTLPNITFVPNTENLSIAFNKNNILVNITVNDTNFKNLTIFLYNSTYALINTTNTTSASYFLNYTNLTYQVYYFNATAYDLANNSNSTNTRNITLVRCTDVDSDSYSAEGGLCGGAADCNDNNAAVHPGETDSCDGIDNDCDGVIDGRDICGGGSTPAPPAPPAPPVPPVPPEQPKPEPEPEAITPSPEPGALPGSPGKYTPSQIKEISKSLQLDFTPKVETSNLKADKLYFVLENKGKKTIKNIDIVVEKPQMEELVVMHPFKIFGWDMGSLIGLYINDAVKEPKLLEWHVEGEAHRDKLKPGESLESKFDIKTPLTKKNKVEIYVKVKSYGQVIFEKTIEVEIEQTKLVIAPDADTEKKKLDLYMVIANQKSRDVKFNVELNMNELSGKYSEQELSAPGGLKEIAKYLKTIFAEYYGPYKVKAFDTVLLAHQYRYDEKFERDYVVRAVLYEDDRKLDEAESRMNLKKG